MRADLEEVEIDGARLLRLRPSTDLRGSFVEFFRQDWLASSRPPLQGNLSHSRAGVLRGMHFHRRQWDHWFAAAGTAFVALADLRSGSPTEHRIVTLSLSEATPGALFIPPGVAHGFYAQSDCSMVYLVDAQFDGSDEYGFAWNDPDLTIPWPSHEPILSDRDRANPTLAEVLLDPPRYPSAVG